MLRRPIYLTLGTLHISNHAGRDRRTVGNLKRSWDGVVTLTTLRQQDKAVREAIAQAVAATFTGASPEQTMQAARDYMAASRAR